MSHDIPNLNDRRADGEPAGTDLLRELETIVETELNRHLATTKKWYPHEYIPWSQGKDFADLGSGDFEAWDESQSTLGAVARKAFVVNLLTEDNLPEYHRTIGSKFSPGSPWATWLRRWTAEENRHGISMRDYLMTTRATDPRALEDDRMEHMSRGFTEGDNKDVLHILAYVTFQELATRISHSNTGKITGDPIAQRLLQRISLDENLHMLFYRNVVAGALDIAPNQTMRAITDEVVDFQMPGANMPEFRRSAVEIATAGIYDLPQHIESVVEPILRQWRVFEREDLSGDGAAARDELAEFMDTQKIRVVKFVEARDRRLARQALLRNS